MKILLISDKDDISDLGIAIKEKIDALLSDQRNNLEYYDISKEDLHHCLGCFQCWTKTPGVCVINDLGRQIAESYVHSDVVIWISPIHFGSYSTAIKRAMDRNIPNILPFFRKVRNEVHHKPRYEQYPEILLIGYGDGLTDAEITTIRSLAEANAVNMMKEEAQTYFCRDKDDIRKIENDLNEYLVGMEA